MPGGWAVAEKQCTTSQESTFAFAGLAGQLWLPGMPIVMCSRDDYCCGTSSGCVGGARVGKIETLRARILKNDLA